MKNDIKEPTKVISDAFKWFAIFYLICFTVGVILSAGLIYVAIHFLQKFW